MSDVLADSREDLIAAARRAMDSAYAPYSGFHVGAALLFDDGAIVTGANSSVPTGAIRSSTRAGSASPGKMSNEQSLSTSLKVWMLLMYFYLRGRIGSALKWRKYEQHEES